MTMNYDNWKCSAPELEDFEELDLTPSFKVGDTVAIAHYPGYVGKVLKVEILSDHVRYDVAFSDDSYDCYGEYELIHA